jgi:aspartate aminotransferase
VRERVEACINENTRAILFTNPGNPTGAVLSRDELKLMLDIAKEHDLFVICDEVYREFVYADEPLMSSLQYEGYEDNVVVIDSVSKRFSACGARIGMLISKNKKLMAECMKWCQCRLCASTVDQVAAAELYKVGPEYFAAVRAEYMSRRDALMAKLSEIPGVVCKKPEGAFYVMAALPIDDADKFQTWLLNEFDDNGETVMFACGEPFYGTPGKGKNEVRMAYVLKKERLERAMDILAIAIKKYNATH